MNPSTSATNLSLPSVLNGAHSNEFDMLWQLLSTADSCVVDASNVITVDSEGLQMLVDGVHALHRQGRMLAIENPSRALRAASLARAASKILDVMALASAGFS